MYIRLAEFFYGKKINAPNSEFEKLNYTKY